MRTMAMGLALPLNSLVDHGEGRTFVAQTSKRWCFSLMFEWRRLVYGIDSVFNLENFIEMGVHRGFVFMGCFCF